MKSCWTCVLQLCACMCSSLASSATCSSLPNLQLTSQRDTEQVNVPNDRQQRREGENHTSTNPIDGYTTTGCLHLAIHPCPLRNGSSLLLVCGGTQQFPCALFVSTQKFARAHTVHSRRGVVRCTHLLEVAGQLRACSSEQTFISMLFCFVLICFVFLCDCWKFSIVCKLPLLFLVLRGVVCTR